ncbi:MAG: hypothetical protein J0I21_00425 [Alphaproteobacteria bacterium]|nr:hypothetical protein [Alphaproteobacteria bacterium]
MESETTKAILYGQKLLEAAIDIVGASHVELTKEFARDPKIVALTILCRTISNFRASLLLVQHEGILEARTLVRLIYENLLWIGALRERGAAFVQDMLEDEAFNRQALGQLTLQMSADHGADVNGADALKLRSLITEIGKQFPRKKKLHVNKAAGAGVVDLAYVEYSRFSLDAVHCSITALGRHLSSERTNQKTELVVSVVPRTQPAEVLSTVLHACRGLMGVAVGANELLGFTIESDRLTALLAEFERNGWQRND